MNTTTPRTTAAQTATLTGADLAARWGCSQGHLANLRSQGRGPRFYRPTGGRVLYRLEEIMAYEEESLCEPTTGTGTAAR